MEKKTPKEAGTNDPVTAESRAADAVENRAVTVQAPKKERKAVREPVYSAAELAASAETVFGTMPECVLSALRAAGKQKCTVPEAKETVSRFLKKEVK